MVYLFHARDDGKWGAHFVATPGSCRDTVTLRTVPAGSYCLEWLDPGTGSVKASETMRRRGSDLALTTPGYSLDVARRMHLVS